MDLEHLERALRIPYFNVLFTDSTKVTIPAMNDFLDFYLINTDHISGMHWFSILRGKNSWILFDPSECTPINIHNTIIKVLKREARVIIDQRQLQDFESLSCGEHTISFILYIYSLLLNYEHFKYTGNYYSNNLLKFCKKENITPDSFVKRVVYQSNIFNIKHENPKEIRDWLNTILR